MAKIKLTATNPFHGTRACILVDSVTKKSNHRQFKKFMNQLCSISTCKCLSSSASSGENSHPWYSDCDRYGNEIITIGVQ